MKQAISYENGNLLSYADYGDRNGYPILIQHGMIASIDDDGLFDRLVQLGARLICMARPGYGESSPYVMNNIGEWGDIAAALVDELKLSQFDVLGMSSGAPYSYALGYRFPDRVRNIYIFSGTPALYDEHVQALWPYPVDKTATMVELQKLAHELFFSNASAEDRAKPDVRDSMMNDCFGIAQDLKLRVLDWGFGLADVKPTVYMQHSKADEAAPFGTAALTANLLPNCKFDIREDGVHFSSAALDDFIRTVMAEHYQN
jgi:pimeloyl-ACP methyl ester carboxylesterase